MFQVFLDFIQYEFVDLIILSLNTDLLYYNIPLFCAVILFTLIFLRYFIPLKYHFLCKNNINQIFMTIYPLKAKLFTFITIGRFCSVFFFSCVGMFVQAGTSTLCNSEPSRPLRSTCKCYHWRTKIRWLKKKKKKKKKNGAPSWGHPFSSDLLF